MVAVLFTCLQNPATILEKSFEDEKSLDKNKSLLGI